MLLGKYEYLMLKHKHPAIVDRNTWKNMNVLSNIICLKLLFEFTISSISRWTIDRELPNKSTILGRHPGCKDSLPTFW